METAEAGGPWRGLAWCGYGCQRNKPTHTTKGTAGRALDDCPHGHDCKPMRLGMASQRAVLDKEHSASDAEVIVELGCHPSRKQLSMFYHRQPVTGYPGW